MDNGGAIQKDDAAAANDSCASKENPAVITAAILFQMIMINGSWHLISRQISFLAQFMEVRHFENYASEI